MPGYLQNVYGKPRITSTYWSLLCLRRGSFMHILLLWWDVQIQIHNYYSKFITRAPLHNRSYMYPLRRLHRRCTANSSVLELCLGKEGVETCKVSENLLTMKSTESSSFCKNSFGKTIWAPKTASAGERPVSSLGCALSPRSTKGNSSDHVSAAARARSASLRRWCSLSTARSTQGDKLFHVHKCSTVNAH
jgi:hypothetical protein